MFTSTWSPCVHVNEKNHVFTCTFNTREFTTSVHVVYSFLFFINVPKTRFEFIADFVHLIIINFMVKLYFLTTLRT